MADRIHVNLKLEDVLDVPFEWEMKINRIWAGCIEMYFRFLV